MNSLIQRCVNAERIFDRNWPAMMRGFNTIEDMIEHDTGRRYIRVYY